MRKRYRAYAGLWIERGEVLLYDSFDDDPVNIDDCLL